MNSRLKNALEMYGATIQEKGWKAGEALIKQVEAQIPEFRKWAYALGIMLRAEEILNQDDSAFAKKMSIPKY